MEDGALEGDSSPYKVAMMIILFFFSSIDQLEAEIC